MMKSKRTIHSILGLLLLLCCGTGGFAQISIPNASFTDNQDFSTLANSGTSSTVPTGWAFFETGANQNATYTAGTGSSNAGDTYSFGLASNTERAFGGLLSGNLVPTVGVCYTNNTGSAISELTITYTGETWRVGAANRTDGIQFQYNQSTTAINGAGTWTSFPALDYFNPGQATGSGSMLHSSLITSTITGLNIADGATFCFRWNDFNATGADDGIGVDDYSLSNIVLAGPCSSITPLTCDVPVDVTLAGTGLWGVLSCGFGTPGQEKIYSFTPTNSGLHTLQVNSTSGIFIDYFYKLASDGCSSTGWNCLDDISATGDYIFGPLTAGVQYYILLDGESTSSTSQNFQINCDVLMPPANDLCSGATTIPPVDNEICGTTIGAGADDPNGGVDCGTGADALGAGVWYTFQGTGQTWDFFFPQQGEDWDPEVNVYSGSCGALTCVTGDDDGGGGLSAAFSINSVAGTTYYVYVHPANDEGDGTSDFCFNVTLSGAAPVVLTCPMNMTVAACLSQDTVNARFNTWLATASGTGGCNGVLTNNNTGAPSICGGSTTVTFTYTSTCAPTTTTCQATFTVTAPSPVVLSCPTNMTVAACLSQDTVNARFNTWLATASGTGGCNGVLTNNNLGAPSACGGSTTVTFTYTSSCAPTVTTCQATFTVTAAPTVILTCPTNTTVAACQTQAAVNAQFAAWLATASASGGCNGVLTNNNIGAPSAGGGSTTVTFTYTSSCAPTTTTCQATFTVAAAPPVILTCPTNTTAAACQTQAAVNTAFTAWLATATASGGCNGVLTNNNIGAPSACGGSTTVTFTYTSSVAPTTTTCQATFTVAAAPTVILTCPTNTTVASCQTQAAVNAQFTAWLATATASGGCSGVLTNNNTGAPSACGGSTTVTFTYTSSCAPTTTTCQATFTVAASTPVVLNCPAPLTASACLTQAQLNTTYANWLASATTSGGCGGTITNNAPAAPLICNANAQTITVTFSVTNTCTGVATTCTSTFTVPAYPNFTVPAAGATTVACPSQIVQPTPPTVLDACGKTLTPTGPVIVNSPNPITCEGTRTYTWTYTDCSGHVQTWSHVVTVERQPFSVPANGSATVDCPDDTDAQPAAPVVLSNCGEVLTPVVSSTAKPGCEGNRNWNFTYTDCEGNTATWTFIYTVEYLDFSVPASETLTTECPLEAVQPTPPVVVDNCGKNITPTGPVITSTNNANGCEGSRKYEWTYKDCEGNTHTWSRTYNFLYTGDFFIYPDGEDFVGCVLYVQPPVPPTVYDNCGQVVSVTGPTITEDINGCSGTRKYSYVYKDCGGHTKTWNFTFYANDNEPPVGNCPTGSLIGANETNLSCIKDVPCPDTYDFSDKIQELLSVGGFYDVCAGNDLVVTLDSWTDLWECSDDDGDGQFTFGRTFYFSIADQCGNALPLCGVTYSGPCQPIETFVQEDWGYAGDAPGDESGSTIDTTDLQVITQLLANNPLVIGGGTRSITLTDANCVVALLPGLGTPTILSNCQQTNCTGGCNPAGPQGMKNTLAANTIALMLNIRFNNIYNGLTINNVRNQSLGCIEINPNIVDCPNESNVDCKLHIWDQNGVEHVFPYTIGGLLDLSNLFLSGGIPLGLNQVLYYADALNKSIANVNSYWDSDTAVETACDAFVGNGSGAASKSLPTPLPTVGKNSFSIAPNPASNELNVQLGQMETASEVQLVIFNAIGQQVLRNDFGYVTFLNEQLDLSRLQSGMYLVSIKVGNDRYEQKLVISKN